MHEHVVQPEDLALCVRMANAAAEHSGRRVDFVHMPVPRDRDDDAFFAPLDQLHLDDATQVYLGLVHHTDGIDGARRRMAAASGHLAGFGIATECGFGRRPVSQVDELLAMHAELAGELVNSARS